MTKNIMSVDDILDIIYLAKPGGELKAVEEAKQQLHKLLLSKQRLYVVVKPSGTHTDDVQTIDNIHETIEAIPVSAINQLFSEEQK